VKRTTLSERALVLAPRGRDAAIASGMLVEAGIQTTACASLSALIAELNQGAAFILVTEEAIASADLHPLSAWIDDQEEWSDMPFILLTTRGGGLERNPAAARYLEVLGNVTFLERPFHPTTLVSLAQSALRGRMRQYEARARLVALRELNETLERRVHDEVGAREAALAQLHEAQKLETIGQLTGGVAHDFNNLLTPITGALDLIGHRYADDKRSARLIDGALQSAERAKTLVQRLLGFARRQALETRSVDLTRLLEGMRDLIVSSVGPAIELEIVAQDELPSALADPNQLELAILNLCVNARDAMPNGGRLKLTIDRASTADDKAQDDDGDCLRLSVIDTGIGMDAETLARAVEPFYSTKETGKGTGLGLSMVHGLAAQLGGRFELSSARGKGARADLYLPIAEFAATTIVPHVPPPDTMGQRALSILLVDDEELVRSGTAEMLREMGHDVTQAAGGGEALGKLASGFSPDIVVTDYMMPRMDGAEFAGLVAARYPDLPILVITGYAGGDLDIGLPQLAKPFRQTDLAQAIIRLTSREPVA
jgi:signal transduction histidine kinase/CheY-like chemotaxis protein